MEFFRELSQSVKRALQPHRRSNAEEVATSSLTSAKTRPIPADDSPAARVDTALTRADLAASETSPHKARQPVPAVDLSGDYMGLPWTRANHAKFCSREVWTLSEFAKFGTSHHENLQALPKAHDRFRFHDFEAATLIASPNHMIQAGSIKLALEQAGINDQPASSPIDVLGAAAGQTVDNAPYSPNLPVAQSPEAGPVLPAPGESDVTSIYVAQPTAETASTARHAAPLAQPASAVQPAQAGLALHVPSAVQSVETLLAATDDQSVQPMHDAQLAPAEPGHTTAQAEGTLSVVPTPVAAPLDDATAVTRARQSADDASFSAVKLADAEAASLHVPSEVQLAGQCAAANEGADAQPQDLVLAPVLQQPGKAALQAADDTTCTMPALVAVQVPDAASEAPAVQPTAKAESSAVQLADAMPAKMTGQSDNNHVVAAQVCADQSAEAMPVAPATSAIQPADIGPSSQLTDPVPTASAGKSNDARPAVSDIQPLGAMPVESAVQHADASFAVSTIQPEQTKFAEQLADARPLAISAQPVDLSSITPVPQPSYLESAPPATHSDDAMSAVPAADSHKTVAATSPLQQLGNHNEDAQSASAPPARQLTVSVPCAAQPVHAVTPAAASTQSTVSVPRAAQPAHPVMPAAAATRSSVSVPRVAQPAHAVKPAAAASVPRLAGSMQSDAEALAAVLRRSAAFRARLQQRAAAAKVSQQQAAGVPQQQEGGRHLKNHAQKDTYGSPSCGAPELIAPFADISNSNCARTSETQPDKIKKALKQELKQDTQDQKRIQRFVSQNAHTKQLEGAAGLLQTVEPQNRRQTQSQDKGAVTTQTRPKSKLWELPVDQIVAHIEGSSTRLQSQPVQTVAAPHKKKKDCQSDQEDSIKTLVSVFGHRFEPKAKQSTAKAKPSVKQAVKQPVKNTSSEDIVNEWDTTTMVVSDLQYTAMELQRGKRIVESHIENLNRNIPHPHCFFANRGLPQPWSINLHVPDEDFAKGVRIHRREAAAVAHLYLDLMRKYRFEKLLGWNDGKNGPVPAGCVMLIPGKGKGLVANEILNMLDCHNFASFHSDINGGGAIIVQLVAPIRPDSVP